MHLAGAVYAVESNVHIGGHIVFAGNSAQGELTHRTVFMWCKQNLLTDRSEPLVGAYSAPSARSTVLMRTSTFFYPHDFGVV